MSSDHGPVPDFPPLAETFLGPKGEEDYSLILRALEWSEGFELDFIVSNSAIALEAVISRLSRSKNHGQGKYLLLDRPEFLRDLPRLLIESVPAELKQDPAIKPIVVLAKGPTLELEAEWRKAAATLNEQRNRLVRELPASLLLLGPPALIEWVRRSAPDLWSIRGRVIELPIPPAKPVGPETREQRMDFADSASPTRDAEYYLELADEFQNPTRKSHARSYLNLLEMAIRSDRAKWKLDRAETNADTMLNLAQKFDLKEQEAAALLLRGKNFCDKRNFSEARIDVSKALELSIGLGKESIQASAYHAVGNISFEMKKFSEAEEFYRKSLEINKSFGDELGMAKTLHQLGMLAEERRDFQIAEEFYHKSLKLKKIIGDEYSVAATLYQLAIVAIFRHEFKVAEELSRKSLEIFTKFGDEHSLASTLLLLGLAARERRDFRVAEEFCRKSMDIYEKFGDDYGMAFTLNQLGTIACMCDEFEKSGDYFIESIILFRRFQDLSNEKKVINNFKITYDNSPPETLAVLERKWEEAGLPPSFKETFAAMAADPGTPEKVK